MWVYLSSFLDPNHKIQKYFLDIRIAIYGPLILLVLGIIFIFAFLSHVENKKKKLDQ